MFYKIKHGIRNLIKWFPIIWRDRDFDHGFLLDMMSFKMKNMAELHRKYGVTVNSGKYANQLRKCSELAKEISNEDYEGDFKEREKQIEQDLDKLFSSMRKNIRYWWD